MEAPQTAAMRLGSAGLRPTAIRLAVLDEAEVTFWGLCPECHHTEDEDG